MSGKPPLYIHMRPQQKNCRICGESYLGTRTQKVCSKSECVKKRDEGYKAKALRKVKDVSSRNLTSGPCKPMQTGVN